MNTPGESPHKDQWATKSGDAPRVAVAAAPDLPQEIGRYRIEKILGEGGFGRVYLAYDDQLNRPVAIKVPHPERVVRPEDAKAYLTEARVLASLDHPNIVPVYDVGTTPEGLCFVVSKLIEGSDLATRMGQGSLTHIQSAALMAPVADGLHYAHRKGLVHRDIKPGNLLIDISGKPFVADFGLALKEEDFGKGAKFSGTPSYMSPEQARGEGHRVDGRSDIFSLGVVFYELLAGRRPFHSDSMDELLDQITTLEARPVRQVDDAVPMELERICLKALSKRASERYMTAKDMADDLRHFLAPAAAGPSSAVRSDNPSFHPGAPPSVSNPTPIPHLTPPSTPIGPSSDNRPLKIVPKGLRSFDAHDANFFLELLPGPRDRDGLPDSIRFWKTRIEETDPDNTFSVGLIYGPSGCGKSSLVKAGLLPRLGNDVQAVYVEATAGETETRLLNGLRKRCPALPADLGLKETMTALRRGQGMPAGKKVLIVLDQFEQWLHALASRERPDLDQTELVQALRQCDGGRVQCIVMVRDDFWMAATRFMRDLEVRLVEAQNSAAVDLFPVRHAEKVLAAFGRAFAVLPDSAKETGKEQKQFIEQAVAGLSQEGKVICVRLALFADMMKGRSWTPATLKDVGGTEGIGVTFLEETFSANSAPPEHRYHQKAARAVLKALLPESGTDIKGHMRSHGELLEASGYTNRPKDFEDLIRVLDSEIRLITPTDPEANDAGEPRGVSPRSSAARYYQLTHDYLVASLRDWLTRKQKETRRGRAELMLADRAGVWNARLENRQLPSLWQWFTIRRLTRKRNWTNPQRTMMRKASRYHAVRGVALLVILALVGWGGFEGFGSLKAHALRDRLLNANTTDVPVVVADMASYHRWLDPLLRDIQFGGEAIHGSRSQLHVSLALLPTDPRQVAYLYGHLLDAQPQEVAVIRDALLPYKEQLMDKLWAVVEQPAKGKESSRLRGAAALAIYDPDNARWEKSSGPVVEQLVTENPVFLAPWMEAFRPVRLKLLPPLAGIFKDRKDERVSERTLATSILADYAADEPSVLADLLMDADEKQFAVIYAKFKEQGDRALPALTGEIDKKLPAEMPSSDERREKLAKRQANAAVAMLKMNKTEKVWPLLKHGPDPRARSYLIHRFGPLRAEPGAIVKRLDEESDPSIRRALILSLGEFTDAAWSPGERNRVAAKLKEIYRTATDPGLHAATEWLLRHWRHEDWLNKTNENWRKGKEFREKQLADIRRALAKPRASKSENDPTANLRWYINGQGQTMVVIPGPVTFTMGSPETEDGRQKSEPQHERRISRTFAVGAKAVTVAEFKRYFPKHQPPADFTRLPSMPVVGIQWYYAAQYCNWLSKQEGIPANQFCYEVDVAKRQVRLKANYLQLTGYRLPTEAEMEYVTRAGAATSRFYGETEELLPKYAWYVKNAREKTWPVGSLKPNDFGLFDVHGNVFTWCQDRYIAYPNPDGDTIFEDEEDILTINDKDHRVLRGGSFDTQKSLVRSALRTQFMTATTNSNFGFRVARTFPR